MKLSLFVHAVLSTALHSLVSRSRKSCNWALCALFCFSSAEEVTVSLSLSDLNLKCFRVILSEEVWEAVIIIQFRQKFM